MLFQLLLFAAALGGFFAMHRRIGRLEADVARLRGNDMTNIVAAPATPAPVSPPPIDLDAIGAALAARRSPAAPPRERPTLESLIGGRLPIWIGGAALVVAGFFLVRYSIESGLIGPRVRVVFAALFAAALVAAAELARRAPATRDDPRIGQALAGAGVASAYGTLYVAAAQYHLVGPLAGFALMLAVTALALFLALRHGPPTAIMALIGGFAAPLVAGVDAAGLGPLLVYLALFIAALFGLAVRRGWGWLALAAVAAGFGWANMIPLLLGIDATGAVGAFVVALAIAATLALPATGERAPLLRAAPIVAGLVQLMILAPTLDFSVIAWSLYLVLSAAALLLAWRDPTVVAGAPVAAGLVVVLLAAGLGQPAAPATPTAALAATLLFAGPGLLLSRRAPAWSIVALAGFTGPVLVAHALAPALLPAPLWTLAELLLAAGAAFLAWRHRDRTAPHDIGLVGGCAAAGTLAGVALTTLAGPDWAPAALALVLVTLAATTRALAHPTVPRLPALLLLASLLLAIEPIGQLANALGASLIGDRLPYRLLPPLGTILISLALPAALAAALLRWPDSYGSARRWVVPLLAIAGIAVAYTLAKTPLAIADADRFLHLGALERAAITALFAAAGWRLARDRAGTFLLTVAILRFIWFDVVLLDPLTIPQAVGPLPILNLAVALPAILALASWQRATPGWRRLALALTLAAVAGGVRQLAHGSILTGPLGTGENWGYSAALLGLACVWLWRGIATTDRDRRIAGLTLLTAVTLKVFLIDIAALGGLLRILSFLGLGIALIGIGWAYSRVVRSEVAGA